MLSLLSRILVPGMAQADLLLELVMLVSSMASDEKVKYGVKIECSVVRQGDRMIGVV